MPDIVLFVKGAEKVRKRIRFRKKEMVVGRSKECDLAVGHGTLSRQHFRLLHIDDGWWLEDLGSANGTRLNGRRFEGKQSLRDGDRIAAGQVRVVVTKLNSAFTERAEPTRRVSASEAEPAAAVPELSQEIEIAPDLDLGDLHIGDLEYDEADLADCDLFHDIDDDDLMDEEPVDIAPGAQSVQIQFGTMLHNKLQGETGAQPDASALKAYDDIFGDFDAEDELHTEGSTRH